MNEDVVSSEEVTSTTEDSVFIVDTLDIDFHDDLSSFFSHYIVETSDGLIQVFQSLTYGELLISFLLMLLIVIYVLKWIYEVMF